MILFRILKKDFLRKKGVMIVVFTFIMLSALLVAGGSNLIVELNGSLNALFAESKVPHFVQMHAGELDRGEILAWASANGLVKELQIAQMITMDGSALFLGEDGAAEENSIMDISFVQQNGSFDFLLDRENRVIELSPGEIGVPIYYVKRNNLKIGDPVRIGTPMFSREYRIAAFVRDAQMNPSVIHSKRFLVHADDYTDLQTQFSEVEYLIEFLLTDPDRTDEFAASWQAANMPERGPSIDHRLFRILNALTDGMVAAVVIILSLLLMTIAILCLRFTILASIEEDYREIGVMKAIGMAQRDIRRIYLVKYIALGALASLLGWLASLAFSPVLSANITLALGSAPKSLLQHAVPAAAAAGVLLIVAVSCAIILRRFRRISAVQALRSGGAAESTHSGRFLPLRMSGPLEVNLFLGMRDVLQRFRIFGLITFVFFFSSFMIIIPVHFLGTITSPDFISYMGIGRSDIRIDLRQSDRIEERFDQVITSIAEDPDVQRFSPLVTSRFTLVQENGERENIAIETGDFTLFPLDYLQGTAPLRDNEIALSYLSARDREVQLGDTIVLLVDGREREMKLSGIYQDVTNGGRTAKAAIPHDPENVLWYTVSLDLKSAGRIEDKVLTYMDAFHPARITDLESYKAQTLGNTIDQLGKVTLIAIFAGLFVSILITSLFLKMLVTRDSSRIAIMKSLGFPLHSIRIQYLTTTLFLLGIGIAAGTVFSNTAGPGLVSALWAFMGASRIRFVIDPVATYVLLPLLLTAAVSITTLVSITGIRNHSIAATIAE